jgi:hypothetical protein
MATVPTLGDASEHASNCGVPPTAVVSRMTSTSPASSSVTDTAVVDRGG